MELNQIFLFMFFVVVVVILMELSQYAYRKHEENLFI